MWSAIFDTSRSLLEILLQTGLLTRYLPELEPTLCRAQFDTYHVYTVDVGLLLTLTEMKKSVGGFTEEEPLLYGLWGESPDFPALFLAALLHDLGKGGGKNSPPGGPADSPNRDGYTCPPLPTETIRFFVEHHLLLADTALRAI